MSRFISGFLPIILLVATSTLVGCATTDFASDSQARAAVDIPNRFVVGTPGSDETAVPTPGEGCRNPMVDPRDGTQVVLVRSEGDRGDYEAPTGRYGVGERELLRLECSTGRVVGVVFR